MTSRYGGALELDANETTADALESARRLREWKQRQMSAEAAAEREAKRNSTLQTAAISASIAGGAGLGMGAYGLRKFGPGFANRQPAAFAFTLVLSFFMPFMIVGNFTRIRLQGARNKPPLPPVIFADMDR
mmetsp:Transcript_21957/g.47939  ORF Transcript_21957/g.47939 Transcript_21957/m.47939 type:complete len:131 (+) Transcript_21957:200-592(+)|eukprot:6214497-Pleurochrysis_carterae.AAC.3